MGPSKSTIDILSDNLYEYKEGMSEYKLTMYNLEKLFEQPEFKKAKDVCKWT